MLLGLKTHPFNLKAVIKEAVILSYAVPTEIATSLLSPGLSLHDYAHQGKTHAFISVFLAQIEDMRTSFMPVALGQNFFVVHYYLLVRYRDKKGKLQIGQKVLRSDTDQRSIAMFGNVLTPYQYHLADVKISRDPQCFRYQVLTQYGSCNLDVSLDFTQYPYQMPVNSVFKNTKIAKDYFCPTNFTFDYLRQSHSITKVEFVYKDLQAKSVACKVGKVAFFNQQPFKNCTPVLSSSFHLYDLEYSAKSGVNERLGSTSF